MEAGVPAPPPRLSWGALQGGVAGRAIGVQRVAVGTGPHGDLGVWCRCVCLVDMKGVKYWVRALHRQGRCLPNLVLAVLAQSWLCQIRVPAPIGFNASPFPSSLPQLKLCKAKRMPGLQVSGSHPNGLPPSSHSLQCPIPSLVTQSSSSTKGDLHVLRSHSEQEAHERACGHCG